MLDFASITLGNARHSLFYSIFILPDGKVCVETVHGRIGKLLPAAFSLRRMSQLQAAAEPAETQAGIKLP